MRIFRRCLIHFSGAIKGLGIEVLIGLSGKDFVLENSMAVWAIDICISLI